MTHVTLPFVEFLGFLGFFVWVRGGVGFIEIGLYYREDELLIHLLSSVLEAITVAL